MIVSGKDPSDIFDKVLYVGPSYCGKGGIASVLSIYRRHCLPFHYIQTNHPKGTLRGLPFFCLAFPRILIERLRGRRIMHIHHATGKSWTRKLLYARMGKILGYKVVMHCHACGFDAFCQKKGEVHIGKILNSFDAQVVLSDQWQKYFENKLGCENVYVINNPIETNTSAKERKCLTAGIKFLFLGALGHRKGIYDLLHALSKIHGDYELHVGGNGEVEKFKASVATLNLKDKVKFYGWITGKEKQQLMQECDVFVLPSYAEGLPMAILESMSAGMPIISTPVGGIADVIKTGVNGELVTPGNIDALAQALTKYVADPGLVKLQGQKNMQLSSDFTIDKVADKLMTLYKSLL